ncbi:hypothetical protein B296_00003290 [Ensete ventricosum]|uniref:DUF4005 domain-containing protein n=1 Tax=Ensete ventricosum TaxID=4639 RepID=A0A427BAN6_ENSVE|nr:hypothetical protein B296_00003290 [Ensete ventricosum]
MSSVISPLLYIKDACSASSYVPMIQEAWKVKFSSNAFVSKVLCSILTFLKQFSIIYQILCLCFFHLTQLLASSLLSKSLQIQYDKGDPNSVFSWLDRWTSTSFWQPNSKSKKVIDSKGQTNRDNCNMGTESGKSRRSIRTNPAWNIGGGQTNPKYEPERTKRNQKKVPNPPAETVQRHPQSELERVKRNLRKISSTAIKDASEQPEVDTLDQRIEESIDKPEENINTIPNIKADTETALEPVTAGPVDVLLIDDNEDSTLMMNGELSLMEEQFCHENQKTSKTRSSFSAKSEYTDTPVLPSYMSTTESAKAKLRGQVSPRIVSESVDIRRHSLPSSTTNGNMSSSRTKRLIQTGGKGGIGRDVNGMKFNPFILAS